MVGRRTRHTPNGDLTEPLHTGDASDSESASHPTIFTRGVPIQCAISLRVAVGVLIASSIQTRVSDYDPSDTDGKKWVLFPSWYYLGGLSYCAIAVIFTTGKTIGSTLMIVWQAFLGVGMALVYSIVLFACMNVHTQDSTQRILLVCPFAATTKKFAVANNLFFILTIINPADPIGGSGLKTSDDPSFRTANILHNLEVYFLIGIVGSLVSLAIMFVPYPIFAIKRLRKDSKLAAEDILDLLNIIIDSYCFKNKNMDHMNFLKLKLQRKFDAAAARHRRMEALLENAWWEQSFGFHYVLGFHRPIMFNYVKLVGSLISDLRTLSNAMQLEKYDHLHFTYMKNPFIPRNIGQEFLQGGQLHRRTRDVECLQRFCGDYYRYLLVVYVYGFNATVPSTVAYVLGNYLGGSFRATVNRVGGVVAGSVVPSVFQYFIAQICDPRHLNVVLSNIVLFVWLCISMYVCYAGGYSSYAGLVSAFVSTGILMRQSDLCYSNASDNASSIAISSYSSLAQTSVGIVLFIIVELMIYPKSAMYLLRRNIQKTLKLQLEAFEVLFGHHLTKSSSMDAETMEHLREILQVKIPAKHAEQASLLAEAQAEPLMWRPAFSTQKYEKVLESSRRLLNNNTLLFKLYRHSDSLTATIPSVDSKSTHTKWQLATGQFQTAVTDSFKTLEMLFSDAFLYSEPDQTAIFMQMKEAFRLADKDCSGEIDADEVADMLETIFAQSGAVKQGEIHKYVEEFMRVVDKDKSGLVSFEEFVEALENGLKLEVEVYTRRKPKAPALVARRENVLAAIDEDEAGDESENDAPKVGVVESGDHTQSKAPDALEAKVNNSRAAMPSRESYRRSSQASSVDKGKRTSSAASSAPAMCREHDVLNVEEFSSNDIAAQMKTAYVEWLLEERRYEKVSMEELLLLNCLVSGAEGIAKSLTEMAEIVVAS
ncbi:EF-Hand 1, calcium-binding site [Phytophthora cactorum]|nr:EF-Hand 1, calcium-binding site [Phytophthora cactorum]